MGLAYSLLVRLELSIMVNIFFFRASEATAHIMSCHSYAVLTERRKLDNMTRACASVKKVRTLTSLLFLLAFLWILKLLNLKNLAKVVLIVLQEIV